MAEALTVRPIRREDAESWHRMREALWPSAAGEHAAEIETFLAGDRSGDEAFVAVASGATVVGFAEASLRSHAEGCSTSPVAYLEGWWVEEPHRRAGVGAALVGAVERWGSQHGARELASDAELSNEVSHTAHRAVGFGEVSRLVCFRKLLG